MLWDYGVEIEFLVANQTQGSVVAAVVAAGVPCYAAGYSHATHRSSWKVVSDCTVTGPGLSGHELVSPPFFSEEGFEQINKVCAVLAGMNAQINRSCGLHVHIGARRHSVAAMKKLAVLYIENEPIIDSLVPLSRRESNCHYARSIKATHLGRLAAASDLRQIAAVIEPDSIRQRYVKLNFTAFWRHGTVEFRHHSGTVDPKKIIYWVKLVSKMVELAAATANEPLPGAAPQYSAHWRRGRRARVLFQLLTRPEGVTAEEARVALSVRTRPEIHWNLAQAGEGYRSTERRGGHFVYRLGRPEGAAAVEAPSLEGLYRKLGLSDEEKAFWSERAARLASRAVAS